VDQLEELFGGGEATSSFMPLLRSMLMPVGTPFLVLATLRSDFLSKFQSLPAAKELVYEPFHLASMKLEDFRQVIQGPAEIASIDLEPGLVDAMVTDTQTPDALPLLSFTLRELLERYGDDGRLTLTEYREKHSGLRGAH